MQQNLIFGELGKLEKVKFIINDNSFTGIDIHNINDIKLAELGLKLLIKKMKRYGS